jgi:hypothetical protein
MRSEDLHVAPVITWWNTNNLWATQKPTGPLIVRFDSDRYYSIMAGEDERSGGSLLYFGLNTPLPLATNLSMGAERGEYPPQMRFLRMARKEPGVWVDIEKPFWYDVPLWLASGMVDSVEIAHNHMDQGGMIDNEAWGRARNRAQFPSPWGNGLWTQEIYYRILNCGIRLPPSAGSASGVLPNPVGYNRVYVHTENGLSYDAWWNGLRAGRSFVTNGPLLRVKADGHWRGYVFQGKDGKTLSIGLEAALDSRDPIERIEVIKNGLVERTIPASESVRDHFLGPIRFSESGWFLVRAIANVPETFRFASTAPFYVEIGIAPARISRASAQFFLEWLHERSSLIHLSDPLQEAEALKYYSEADRYWQAKIRQSNAN